MEGLRKLEVKEANRDIIRNYLKDRRAEIEIEGGKIEWEINRGVPQGSVLGPALWNIGFNEVVKAGGKDGMVVCYADDTLILMEGKELGKLLKKVEERASKMVKEIEGLGLQVAAEKTEMVVFTKKRSEYGERREIRLNGVCIRAKNDMKYLGIRLDERLNYTAQIREAYGKTMRAMNSMGALLGNIKGPTQGKKKLLTNVGQSIFLYGVPIWGNSIGKGKNKEMVGKVSRACALRIAAAYRTVSTEAAEVIASSPPLELIAIMRKEKYERLRQLGMRNLSVKEKIRVRRRIGKEVYKDMVSKWQDKWALETGKAIWTRKIIKDVRVWEGRRHGKIDYYLTQFLSGHGAFNEYLYRFKKRQSPMCGVCRVQEDAEHVVLRCPRWNRERGDLDKGEEGETMTSRKLVGIVIRNKEKWKELAEAVGRILRAKEMEEREMGF
ncbi:Putative 115 kDa protein in type-1 retrotransposable element R1DM [Anthophora retusa]